MLKHLAPAAHGISCGFTMNGLPLIRSYHPTDTEPDDIFTSNSENLTTLPLEGEGNRNTYSSRTSHPLGYLILEAIQFIGKGAVLVPMIR